MTTKKIPFNYDINRMLAVDLIAIIHIDDYDTRFLELTLFDDGTPFSVEGCIVTSRFVTISGSYLLSDNVPCEATGNTITIPIDAAAVQMMACDIKIEVNIVDGEKILTLPFPLWVRVRGSILETAHVTPESQGTIPELLKEAAEELERVKDFVTAENVFEILDGTLQGNPNTAPTLLIDNTIDQQFNPDGHWIMFYIDSDNVRHNLFDFSNLPSGGTSDYSELENKPSINNVTLQGNKTSNELGLQPLINNYFTVENNEYISYDFNSVGAGVNSVLYCVPFERISNFPNSLVDKISQSGRLYIFHYVHLTVGARYLIRRIMGYDLNGKYAEFAQYCTVGNENTVISKSDWVELTGGGSQIASGVVNQNGTISFYDADGNLLFTTTGASVIGPQGAPGQDYVLTSQDKTDIANIVLQLLPTTQGVLYGNTSN